MEKHLPYKNWHEIFVISAGDLIIVELPICLAFFYVLTYLARKVCSLRNRYTGNLEECNIMTFVDPKLNRVTLSGTMATASDPTTYSSGRCGLVPE